MLSGQGTASKYLIFSAFLEHRAAVRPCVVWLFVHEAAKTVPFSKTIENITAEINLNIPNWDRGPSRGPRALTITMAVCPVFVYQPVTFGVCSLYTP